MNLQRQIVIWTIASLAAVAAAQTPKTDLSIVGHWRGNMYKDTIFKFRSDGTYSSQSLEKSVRGHRDVTFKSSGTYRYANHVIIFIPSRQEAFQKGKPFPKILKEVGLSVGRESRMPIKWISRDKWSPTEVGIGHFVRTR